MLSILIIDQTFQHFAYNYVDAQAGETENSFIQILSEHGASHNFDVGYPVRLCGTLYTLLTGNFLLRIIVFIEKYFSILRFK